MCSRPITSGTDTFACRSCNECIAKRTQTWVARCMAETAISKEALVVALTYRNNSDDTAPDGAKMFKYSDVQSFMKKLREEYYRKYKARNEIRFLIAGERGSKKDRVHWHLILWADRPLVTLGTTTDAQQANTLDALAMDRRCHWSFWTHGHVYAEEPTQKAMTYCIKYALKEQFNVVRAQRTMRFTKAENSGASYFRMSKAPPLGWRYLQQRLDRWAEIGAVPTDTRIKIEGYSGYWYPDGKFRHHMLLSLHQINQQHIQEHGKPCAQFNTLSMSLVDGDKDWETLHYGEIEGADALEEYDQHEFEERIGAEAAKRRANCGTAFVCARCWLGANTETRQLAREYRAHLVREYITDTEGPDKQTFENFVKHKGQINPACGLNDT